MSASEANWREQLQRWSRPPRRLSFTAAGKYFVAMTLGVGFGAINTGNNLLFLLLGMMLSLILASGILSEAVLRGLRARRMPPARIFAGLRVLAQFQIENVGSWASLSVEFGEQRARCVNGPLRGQRLGPEPTSWWKFWKHGKSKEGAAVTVASAYCMRIDSHDTIDVVAPYWLPRRGLYEMPGLVISTRFPFGLFDKSRDIEDSAHFVVFPRPRPAEDWLGSVHARFGDVNSNRRGHGEEFFGLRELLPGEDRRLVHWKTSARRGELIVRQLEDQEQRAVELCLLNCTGAPAHQRHLMEPAFEFGLEKTVGLLQDLVMRGYQVGLRTTDESIPIGSSGLHLDRMLRILATIELKDGLHPLQAGTDEHRSPGQAGRRAGRVMLGLPGVLPGMAGAGPDFEMSLAFEPAPRDGGSL